MRYYNSNLMRATSEVNCNPIRNGVIKINTSNEQLSKFVPNEIIRELIAAMHKQPIRPNKLSRNTTKEVHRFIPRNDLM